MRIAINASGSILPLSLAVIVILSVCAGTTFFAAHEVLRLLGEFSKNTNANLVSDHKVFMQQQNQVIGGIIDFKQILSGAKLCIAIPGRPTKTASGFSLSPSAVVATSDCELSDKLLVADGNLISKEAIDISGLPAQKISATGYIDISGSLTVNGAVRIIAGGDLRVSKIIAAKDTSLTLISSTGFVSVPSVEGEIAIAAYGHLGSAIAPEARVGGTSLSIPLLKQVSLGILPLTAE